MGNRGREALVRNGAPRDALKIEYGPPTRIYRLEDGKEVLPELLVHDRKGWRIVDDVNFKKFCPEISVDNFLADLDE